MRLRESGLSVGFAYATNQSFAAASSGHRKSNPAFNANIHTSSLL